MGPWDEPEFDGDAWEDAEPREHPRDPVVDEAKKVLRHFLAERATEVFYQRQLQVIFEGKFFHWITAYALSELVAEGLIASDQQALPAGGSITVYRERSHRYWRRQAKEIVELVAQFSAEAFTSRLGRQGELMFDAALATAGFIPTAKKVRDYKGKFWTATGHDLDRIYERDGVAYGAEVKNTLGYIERQEFLFKVLMCKHLEVRPLFIVRMAPKNYINDVWKQGGYTLVFKYQLYPFGQKAFADAVRQRLVLPVDCPAMIEEGTVQRFLNWHLRTLQNVG